MYINKNKKVERIGGGRVRGLILEDSNFPEYVNHV
jgi:hypothetical protein